MRIEASDTRRFEWKYRVPRELGAKLVEGLRLHTEPDPHSIAEMDHAYPVRSLYYDTEDLRFYHETKDGVKIRRKIRVRNYGDDLCFLEIKRKIHRRVLKDRVSVHRSQVAGALNGVDPAVLMANRSATDLQTLERFRLSLRTLDLVPAVLITYQRRAMVDPLLPHLRITLDSDLRSCSPAGEDTMFEAAALRTFEDRWVLELKFEDRPPGWLMQLVSELRLRREPFSKYCAGIDGATGRAGGRERAEGTGS